MNGVRHQALKRWAREEAQRFEAETGRKVVSAVPRRDWQYLAIRYELPKEHWWQFWRPCLGAANVTVPANAGRVTVSASGQ